ncbi:excinuclease ABC subunit UvrC [Ferribacterium limneticum]|uniref:excinuclease ABC subunit UvrC n=1 Tax=Ferribacterium limneticum TaxID=76259 RepID=UPI001CFA359F|nr:excinuclease ABC subunit UvrC [Ferribacterium limneticum]UCV30247.1 excinuclease ABC subunit UvrC [Ferribacterium limneticum]UCV34166.1 excinuclease ABC subunit UvrC [Ferribacterium limneticum]
MSFDAKAFLATLTELPGVYRMLDSNGSVLYVGKAKNLKKRVSSYFRENLSSPRIAHMVSQIAAIETTATRTEAEALLLENNLIKSLAPRYNILFRDDKSYPYIVLSKGKFPRLGFFRGNPDRKADYFGPYPSSWAVRDSIHLLQKMFRLRTCEDTVFSNRSRPCLLYQIKRCSGPCVGFIAADDYAADIQLAAMFLLGKQQEVTRRLTKSMEEASSKLAFEQAAVFRDQIQSLHQVQEKQFVSSSKGEDVDILVAIREAGQLCVNLAMVRGGRHLGDRPFFPTNAGDSEASDACAAFIRQHYAVHPAPARILSSPLPSEEDTGETEVTLAELAGRPVPVQEGRGATHKAWIEMAMQNARLAILARNQATAQQEQRLAALQEALQLPESISRIECFDISHTMGEATVASCVVYEGNRMKKSDYRRFNIRDIQAGDDYAAMRQAVSRRYDSIAGGEGAAPDLILIDGGKGQVSSAFSALADLGLTHLPMIGVAKGEERKPGLETLIFPEGREPLQLPPQHPALHLIQEIRDEAHRFAITGHRAQRGKARKTSTLESLPGIGPARRKALVARFGGLPGVLAASTDQLAEVPGISREMAEKIYSALH